MDISFAGVFHERTILTFVMQGEGHAGIPILMGTQEADAVKAAAGDDNEGGGHAVGLTGS